MEDLVRQDTLALRLKLQQVNEFITAYERAINGLNDRVSVAAILTTNATPEEVVRAMRDGLAFMAQVEVAKSLIQEDLHRIRKTAAAKVFAASGTSIVAAVRQLESLIQNPSAKMQDTFVQEIEAISNQIVQAMRLALEPAVILRDDLMAELGRREAPAKKGQQQKTLKHPSSEADWIFYPGGFTVFKRAFNLSGVSWKLLRVLVHARLPVQPGDLKEAIAANIIEDSTLRGDLTNLRNDLRSLFGLPPQYDPIPHADRGANVAWHLAEDLPSRIRAHCSAEKQRKP